MLPRQIHSFLSPKCETKKSSKIHRFGVFAKENIKIGELIALWGGFIMDKQEVAGLPKEILDFDYPVQIYEGFYLGPKSVEDLDGSEMFNHSCEPNAGVKGQNVLVARKDIAAGEEICFDYETTDTEGMYFKCKCSSVDCRGIIDGKSWENTEFQLHNEDYLSWYILNKIRKLKRQESSVLIKETSPTIQA